MLGFSAINEFAINEFGPLLIDELPRTGQLFLTPLYRVSISVVPRYKGSVRMVPK